MPLKPAFALPFRRGMILIERNIFFSRGSSDKIDLRRSGRTAKAAKNLKQGTFCAQQRNLSIMFVDQAEIYVKGGDGGDGCVSFRRETFVPRGGPDGGDGGDGGNIYFEAVTNLDTLMDFSGHHHWRAPDGKKGMGKKMAGRNGKHLIIQVPQGTLIYDKDTGILLKDLTGPGEKVCIARGGMGGRGNVHFTTSVEQAPQHAESGKAGQERNLHLELKLIADVGLVGKPNAGKSTLISHVSQARPKIADYPFTTLHPVLGIAELSRHKRIVLADLPGLIEGAHEGAGLGDTFLKHIERTRIIVHLLDIMPLDGSDPVQNYYLIRNELNKYSNILAAKPELIVVNKMDLTNTDEMLDQLREELGKPVTAISAVTGKGLASMLEQLWDMIQEQREIELAQAKEKLSEVFLSEAPMGSEDVTEDEFLDSGEEES
jgi:GTP-binding protein